MPLHCKHCGHEIELISDTEGRLLWIHKYSQLCQCTTNVWTTIAEPSDEDNIKVIKGLIKSVNDLIEEIRGLSK